MNDVRKTSRDLRADPTTPGTSDAGDFVTGMWFIVGVIIGCTGWAWIVDSTELSAPVQWLGQGAAISACIVVASAIPLVFRRNNYDWKRILRGPATGVVLVLAVWGTAAVAGHWFTPKFATGAWCAALGVYGFVAHKFQQPGGRMGFMLWGYGVFVIIGAITMYGAVAGLSGEEGNTSKERAALTPPTKREPRENVSSTLATDSHKEQNELPFEISSITPPADYETVVLKMPYSHGGLWSVAWAPDATWLAGGTGVMSMTFRGTTRAKGGDVLVWDIGDGSRRKLGAHGARVDRLLVTPDGKTLISVSRENGRIMFWEMPDGKLLGEVNFPTAEITAPSGWPLVQLSPSGAHVAVVTKRNAQLAGHEYITGGDLLVWSTEARELALHWRDTGLSQFALCSSNQQIVGVVGKHYVNSRGDRRYVSSRKHLTAWKDSSAVPYKSREYKHRSPYGVILLPQESVARSLELDNFEFRLVDYDTETMEERNSTVFNETRSRSLSGSALRFSHGGRLVVVPSKREFQVLDSGTGESLLHLKFAKNRSSGPFSMSASRDLQCLVAASDLDKVYVIRFQRTEANRARAN